MAPKRRAESTPELVTDPKRPHVSIIRINSDVPDELLNTSTGVMTLGADLDLSNISNDSIFNTQDAMAAIQNTAPPVDMVRVPRDMLKEILDHVQSLKTEVTMLKDLVTTLDTKVTSYQQKAPVTQLPSSNQTRQPPVSTSHTTSSQHSTPAAGTSNNIPTVRSGRSDPNLKLKVIPDWGKRFHLRRDYYRSHDKNLKQAAIYSGFLEGPEPYIPKKYRPKFARDEYDYKLSEQISIQEMRTQVDKWVYYADLSHQKYTDLDEQILQDLKKHRVVHERDCLINLWKTEVTTAEQKGESLNDKELDFMCKLPETDSYSGYVQSVTHTSRRQGGFYKKRYYSRNSRNSNWNRSQRDP